jgi:hypothetical protein
MAAKQTKYGKNIWTGIPPKVMAKMQEHAAQDPEPVPTHKALLYVDGDAMPGAYYFQTQWVWGVSGKGNPPVTHDHSYDEFLGFFGSNMERPEDLCGEVEVTLGDEKHTITKSCVILIPKGVKHCPITFKKVESPIFYFATAPSHGYSKENIDKYKK